MSAVRIPRMAGLVNAFLVEEDDGLTLIDTTMGRGAAKAIFAEAGKLGRPIVRIALTHAHQDHIGGLDALAAELPGIEVLLSTRDAKLLAKDTSPEPGEPADAKVRGGISGAKTRPTRLLEPGDRVGSLEVVAAPGHTPGHIAFLDTRDRAARDVAVGERADEVGVGRGQQVGAADVLACLAQDADERLAEVARAARDEDPHR